MNMHDLGYWGFVFVICGWVLGIGIMIVGCMKGGFC